MLGSTTRHSPYDYDPSGRLIRHSVGQTQSARRGAYLGNTTASFSYDLADNLSVKQTAAGETISYSYDPVGRILAAIGLHEEYFYFDPAGNLLPRAQQDIGKVKGNRLVSYQDIRYSYDIYGNLLSRRKGNVETLFRWDAEHQLTESISQRDGVKQVTRYDYDALGRRIQKTDAFDCTNFLWDGNLMLQSRRANKEALFIFELNSFVLLATVQNDATYWYHCDHIGTPQELTDQDGEVVWAADYKVWGEAKIRANGTTTTRKYFHASQADVQQPFRFQGQQLDAETGLHYNRFRYYDPCVGRYISPDPISIAGGLNVFQFTPNPNNWADPLGLTAKELARRMALDGRAVNPGQTPHHIAQENCNKNKHVQGTREILQRNGIDIDDSPNGARVWGTHPSQEAKPGHPGKTAATAQGTRHAGPHIHSDLNDKLIYQILKNAEKKGANIENIMRDLGRRIENGSWKTTFACCCS